MFKKISAAILALVFCVCSAGAAWAAGDQVDSQYSSVSGLCLHEEQFSSDHNMNDLFSSFSEYFSSGNWTISEARIVLSYTVTQIVDRDLSSITLSINGQTFYSQRVEPAAEGEELTLTVLIPVSFLKKGLNTLTVDTYIRTVDSHPCVDDVSKANWIVFSKESCVSLSYTPKNECTTISEFYEQFVSIDSLENCLSTVLIPESAGGTELTAAALVLAGVSGQAEMYYNNISLETADEASFSNFRNVICICELASLPNNLKEMLSSDELVDAQKSAVIALLQVNDCEVLLLTGVDEEAILNAARLLGNASYIAQIHKEFREVSSEEDVLVPAAASEQYITLTEAGTGLTGLFTHSASFYISNPENQELSYSSELSLSMRYSENLDFNRSLVTVYVNDVPIGSKKLEKENAQGDTLVLDVPTDLDVSGNFTIRVAFDLEVPDVWCYLRLYDTPWAWISSDSTLKLYTENITSLIFENYPAPFVSDGTLNNVVIVLPDSPSSSDLRVLSGTMLTLGRYLKDNRGNLRVITSEPKSDISSANIIGIGRYEKNAVAQKFNSKLFFRFSSDGLTIESNEKMLIDPDYGATLGVVQLLDSPYGDGRALLLISGVSDEATRRGAAYLASSDMLWSLYGDGFVADGEAIICHRFKEDNAKIQPDSIKEQLLNRADLLGIEIVLGIVIILIIVAGALLWRKYRTKWKGD